MEKAILPSATAMLRVEYIHYRTSGLAAMHAVILNVLLLILSGLEDVWWGSERV